MSRLLTPLIAVSFLFAGWSATIPQTARARPPALRILKIHSERVDAYTERVCVQISGFQTPTVRALPGENPRVFVDFLGVEAWSGPSQIETEGQLILRLRIHLHHEENRFRIVLDLEPRGDYVVNPTYIESANIFCLEVQLKHPDPHRPAAPL